MHLHDILFKQSWKLRGHLPNIAKLLLIHFHVQSDSQIVHHNWFQCWTKYFVHAA
jgi:hypothetical protein